LRNTACVTDRWVGSNEGHQGGKAKTPEELLDVLQFINWIEYEIGGLTRPTHTFYLKQNPILGQRLSSNSKNQDFVGRDLHADDINHLYNATRAYLKVAQLKEWTVVDVVKPNIDQNDRNLMANAEPYELLKTPDEIHKEIWEVAQSFIKN